MSIGGREREIGRIERWRGGSLRCHRGLPSCASSLLRPSLLDASHSQYRQQPTPGDYWQRILNRFKGLDQSIDAFLLGQAGQAGQVRVGALARRDVTEEVRA